MEVTGEYPADWFRVNITGLSAPLSVTMHRIYILDAHAYGHDAVMREPLRTVGNCDFALFEAEGAIVLESAVYKSGDAYVFTPDALTEFHPGEQTSVMLCEADGQLRYEEAHILYVQMEQFGALSVATGPDERVIACGDADIVNGAVILAAPDRIVSVSEYYDLQEEFRAIWQAQYESIDDIFRANRARRNP